MTCYSYVIKDFSFFVVMPLTEEIYLFTSLIILNRTRHMDPLVEDAAKTVITKIYHARGWSFLQ